MNWNPDVGIPLAIAGALLLVVIAIFGRPRKPGQGWRQKSSKPGRGQRREPRLSAGQQEGDEHDQTEPNADDVTPHQAAFDLGEAASQAGLPAAGEHVPGRRPADVAPQQIVTLLVKARDEMLIDGASIVIAAEKLGLTYGHMGIFHRLLESDPAGEPIFSVANLVKPGSFNLQEVHEIETQGLTFFMTLPGPLTALGAWETMLPAAQRMAELLDAVLLDEDHNALGRQRIAHIRDELRRFDRVREQKARRRW